MLKLQVLMICAVAFSATIVSAVAGGPDFPWHELHGKNRGLWYVDWGLTQRLNPANKNLEKHDALLRPSNLWVVMDGRQELALLPSQHLKQLKVRKVDYAILVKRQILDPQLMTWQEVAELWIFSETQGTTSQLHILPYLPTEKQPKPGPPSHILSVTMHYLPVPGSEPLLVLGVQKAGQQTIDFYLVLQRSKLLPLPGQ